MRKEQLLFHLEIALSVNRIAERILRPPAESDLAGRISGTMASEREVEERGPGDEAPRKLFDHAFFYPKKAPFLSTEIGALYTKKLCK